MTLNFRSIYSDHLADSERFFRSHGILSSEFAFFSSKLAELSRHKGYDDDMTHGFVTINIRYQPDTDNQDRSNPSTSSNEKDDEHDTPSLK